MSEEEQEAWKDFIGDFGNFVTRHLEPYYEELTFPIGGHPPSTPEGVPLSTRDLRLELARLRGVHGERVEQLEMELVTAQSHISELERQLAELRAGPVPRARPNWASSLQPAVDLDSPSHFLVLDREEILERGAEEAEADRIQADLEEVETQ